MRTRRERQLGAVGGAALAILFVFGFVTSVSTRAHSSGAGTVFPYSLTATSPSFFATEARIRASVQSSLGARTLSSNATPPLALLADPQKEIGNSESAGCPYVSERVGTAPVDDCVFGDRASKRAIVLEGDSRAQMWFDAVDTIATASHYRLYFLYKAGCPSAMASVTLLDGSQGDVPWPECDQWHRFVVQTLASLRPDVVITSSQPDLVLTGTTAAAPPAVAEADFLAFYRAMPSSARLVVIGGFPEPVARRPSLCLSRAPGDVGACAWTIPASVAALNAGVRAAVIEAHAMFVDQGPWLCVGDRCPAAIGAMIPYTLDGYHLNRPYSVALTGVLWNHLLPALEAR